METMREYERSIQGVKVYAGVNVECFLYNNVAGDPCASGYFGKRGNPSFRYKYRNTEEAVNRINSFITAAKAKEESDKLRKAEDVKYKKELFQRVEVGSIFVSSWGYDQTNVDAFQVIEKKGSATLILKEISLSIVEDSDHGNMACNVVPVKDSFLEDTHLKEKRISRFGISINSYQTASLWDGKETYYKSWYA